MSLLDSAFALITQPNRRRFGLIIPDIVIEEIAHDGLQITEFPVETGAPITDHAYKRPSEVIMRCGFSNSTAQTEGYVQIVYQAILILQASRVPFTVTTGKRRYRDMLVSSIVQTTDQESEYALNVIVSLKQVIITSTSGSGVMEVANQADASQTAPPVNSGVRDGIPVPVQ